MTAALLRRPAVMTAVLLAVLGVPGIAGAQPDVSDGGIRQSVRTIAPDDFVRDIDPPKFVQPLETEEASGGRVTVRISSDVLFDFNKATLTDTARRRIERLAPRLRQATGTIEVSGHSDGIGDPGYNMDLSDRRAQAVKTELERVLGGSGPAIEAQGFGETKPVAPELVGGKDDPDARARNRRVEITFAGG